MRKLYTDGASKGNGSKNQRAFVAVYDDARREIVVDESIGSHTNNEAEFIAIMRALDYAIAQGITGSVCIVTDSQLTCNQIQGRWQVKAEHLRPMVQLCQRKLREAGAEITWVPREQNHAGKYIESRYRSPANASPAGAEKVAATPPAPMPTANPTHRPRPQRLPSPPSLRRTVPYFRIPLDD